VNIGILDEETELELEKIRNKRQSLKCAKNTACAVLWGSYCGRSNMGSVFALCSTTRAQNEKNWNMLSRRRDRSTSLPSRVIEIVN
jgi:hypothetical protein